MTTMENENIGPSDDKLLGELAEELRRIKAEDAQVSFDTPVESDGGPLLKIRIGLDFWHLAPPEFRTLLKDLPDGAGSEGLTTALEMHAMHVWQGPSPPQPRSIDT